MRAQERLADVLDDRVFLRRRVLRLRCHLAEAFRQRGKHRVRIRAVFERALGEAQRSRQRTLLLLRAVADHTQRAVNLRALRERLLIPSAHDLKVITPLQSLHPCRAHRHAPCGHNHRTRTSCRWNVRKVRRVCADTIAFEQQPDFLIRQRPRPNTHARDFAFSKVATKVRRSPTNPENIPGHIRLGQLRILRHDLSIEPQPRPTRAHSDHSRVRLSVAHLFATRYRAKPANVIDQPTIANE